MSNPGPSRYGSSYKNRKWAAYITYSSAVKNATTSTVTVNLYFRSVGTCHTWGQVGKYCSGNIKIAGSQVASFSAGSQSWQNPSSNPGKKVLTGTKDVGRGNGATTAAVSGFVNLNSSSAYHSSSGGSTADGSCSIASRDAYTVTYNGNGATSIGYGSQSIYYGSTGTFPSVSRTGYTFNRWNGIYNSGVATPAVTGAVTDLAYWIENTGTLYYNANGHGTAPGSVTMKYTTTTTAASMSNVTGYTFLRWNTAANGSGTNYNTGATINAANSNPPSSLTLYAQWQINSHTLTIDPNGGAYDGSASTQTFTQYYKTTKTITAPTKDEAIFLGWALSGGGSLSNDIYTFGDADGTLTATWLDSMAVTVLQSNGNLIFFRTYETYTNDTTGTFEDTLENEYSGRIFTNVENTNNQPWSTYNTSITNVSVISGYEIKPVNMSSWFNGCINLTTCNLTGINTNQTTTMENMFNNCPELKTITVDENFKFNGNGISTESYKPKFPGVMWLHSSIGSKTPQEIITNYDTNASTWKGTWTRLFHKVYAKTSNGWKQLDTPLKCNVSGTWKQVKKGYVKIGGQWKLI